MNGLRIMQNRIKYSSRF